MDFQLLEGEIVECVEMIVIKVPLSDKTMSDKSDEVFRRCPTKFCPRKHFQVVLLDKSYGISYKL